MGQMDTIHVTAASDDRMAAGLGIGLFSMFRRTKTPIHAHLVLDNISPINLERFALLDKQFDHQITIIKPDFKDDYASAKTGTHVNKVAYYRLNMGEYMQDVERVIWFDSDMLCLGDIQPLWTEDLEGLPIGAVNDPASIEVTAEGIEYEKIGLQKTDPYFNSGLLLVDLNQWRSLGTKERVLRHMSEDPNFGRFRDQSRLNYFFAKQWKELPEKYNVQARVVGLQSPLPPSDPDAFHEALVDPVIVHFNGPCKPWQIKMLSPYKKAYRREWMRSPWRDWSEKSSDPIREWRWFLGDLRRHWRRWLWIRGEINKRHSSALFE